MKRQTDDAADVINDLALLHHVVSLNEIDHRFAVHGGQIDYFIDTNIYRFALDPVQSVSEGRSPMALFDRYGTSEEMALLPASFEAAEYIFSGALPGQLKRAGVRVSDGHTAEMERFIAALARGDATPAKNVLTTRLAGYSDALKQASRGGFDSAEIVELAENASSLVEEMFSGSSDLLIGVERLGKRWIRARTNGDYQAAAAEVSHAQIYEWMTRIACGYIGDRFRSVDEDEFRLSRLDVRRQQLARNDARTILEIEHLNQSSAKRTVFISSSRGLHRAYRQWYVEGRQRRQSVPHYALRHPLQYLPLINLSSFAEIFGDTREDAALRRLFVDIKATLDGFLDPWRGEPDFHDVLGMLDRIDHHGHASRTYDIDLVMRQIEWREVEVEAREFVKTWRLAYANAALMTLPAIRLRHEEHRDILARAVELAEGDHLKAQGVLVANIEIDHASAMFWSLGQQADREHLLLPEDLREHDNVRVVPILIAFDTDEGPDITAALRGRVSDAVELVRAFKVDDAARSLSPKRLLAGACLGLAMAEYDVAKRLCERGLLGEGKSESESPRQEVLSEFQYLYGLAVRFDCRSTKEYQDALKRLDQSAAKSGSSEADRIRRGRSHVETGTLKMAAALRQLSIEKYGSSAIWTELDGDFRPGMTRRLLAEAGAEFAAAQSEVDTDLPDSEVISRLRLQLAVNSISCFTLQSLADVKEIEVVDLAAWAYELVRDETDLLKWIATLNIDAYETLTGARDNFPGPRSAVYVDLYSDLERFSNFVMTRRFIAGSDRDLLRLYSRSLGRADTG